MSEIPYGDVVVPDETTGEPIINPEYYEDYPALRNVKPVNIEEHFAKIKSENNSIMITFIPCIVFFGAFFGASSFSTCTQETIMCWYVTFFWTFIGGIIGFICVSIFMKKTIYAIIATIIMHNLGMPVFSVIFCGSVILNIFLLLSP